MFCVICVFFWLCHVVVFDAFLKTRSFRSACPHINLIVHTHFRDRMMNCRWGGMSGWRNKSNGLVHVVMPPLDMPTSIGLKKPQGLITEQLSAQKKPIQKRKSVFLCHRDRKINCRDEASQISVMNMVAAGTIIPASFLHPIPNNREKIWTMNWLND